MAKDPYKDPQIWLDRRSGYRAYNKQALDDGRKFTRWFSGNLEELRSALADMLGDGKLGPLSNHININTRAALAEMMFRAPTAYVEPLVNFGPSVFTKKLSAIETALLNDNIEENDFFTEGRRMLLDGLLTPMMIAKVGYSNDIVTDEDMIKAERRHAMNENDTMLRGGKPKVDPEDYHAGHIETHDTVIAAIERGDIEAPKGVLNYLKKHNKFHADEARKQGIRTMETVRHESVFIERVSPFVFSCDPVAGRAGRRRWVMEEFLRPVDEVRKDRRYDATARMEVEAANLDEVDGEIVKKAKDTFTGGDTVEDFALMFQAVDLQNGRFYTFAQGSKQKRYLRDKEYEDFDILPGGPYITASFEEDPLRDCGIAPPKIYEGHQEMVSYLDTLIAIVARRSVPMMGAVGSALDAEDIQKIREGIPSALLNFKNVDPGMKLENLIQRIPVPEASDFLFNARLLHERGAERYSGIGSAKSGGGDMSRTATASAIVNESGSNLSDDRSAVMDHFFSRIFRAVLRLNRKWLTPIKVAEVCGDGALEDGGWPKNGFADRDIVRDKGAMVIPGSSKRKNTAVEQKLAVELLAVVSKIPTAPPTLTVKLLERVFDMSGMYAISLDSMEQAAQMAEVEQMMAGIGGDPSMAGPAGAPGAAPPQPGAGGPNPASRTSRRGETRGEGTQAAVNQGAMNPGGGRVPSGAP